MSTPISESETLEELSEPPVAAPTGINKILVEKYGYEWVDGSAYKPGTAPQPVAPAPVDPTTDPGLDGIDDPFAPVPPVDGAFDPAPIDPFPPTRGVDDPFGPAPIGPVPIDPFAPPLNPNAPWPAPVDSYPSEDFVPPPEDFAPPPMDIIF